MSLWEDAYKMKREINSKPSQTAEFATKRGYEEEISSIHSGNKVSKEQNHNTSEPWEGTLRGSARNSRSSDSNNDARARKRVNIYFKPSPERVPASYAPTLEQMRSSLDKIWANILLETKEIPDSLFLCGSTQGEGNTFISFHLALFLSVVCNMKTLYVDTNVDSAGYNSMIPQIQDYPGLASYFIENQSLSSLILQSEYENLFILPSGVKRDNGGTRNIIFQKEFVEEFMDYCRNNFDITILDGQPIVSYPGIIEFAKVVNKVVLVCRYGYSRREVSSLTIDKLRKNAVPIIGVILNDRQYPIPDSVYNILK